ncbi:MAG: cytochrome c oxidase assembly protein [Alphaproteobacteria bacterium]|nr:cytochrome c oxidase assembly protein [Alphaproteobacteria bacterium]MCD8520128.1 cytochrome c oxidase assembly protein [Alphaproteobacteria bacterium]MCD8525945.1 cytochrome c oxidase assembly protein [Alphaproteobacteria bacterium]MCD8571083.1 cytochrome c oxidase assembly protein [Alphaproteobacteria bacterium]
MSQNSPYDPELARRNARMGLRVLGIVVAMVGLSFASVPLYSLFCQVTGFSGTTQRAASLPDTVLERTVKVQFNADVDHNMPWTFKPEQREITIQLGQKGLANYHAKNPMKIPVGGTALYNVTPLKAGKYFHKIQCFCFDEQILAPGQDVSMPVLFYVDPALNDDPNMDDVDVITLSYTFYRAESEELDTALEAFYNAEDGVIKAPVN